MSNKFDDCGQCRFSRTRSNRTPCSDCDMGEQFEDADRAGVDAIFHEPATRFGESVTTDEDPQTDSQDNEHD